MQRIFVREERAWEGGPAEVDMLVVSACQEGHQTNDAEQAGKNKRKDIHSSIVIGKEVFRRSDTPCIRTPVPCIRCRFVSQSANSYASGLATTIDTFRRHRL